MQHQMLVTDRGVIVEGFAPPGTAPDATLNDVLAAGWRVESQVACGKGVMILLERPDPKPAVAGVTVIGTRREGYVPPPGSTPMARPYPGPGPLPPPNPWGGKAYPPM